MSKLQGTNYFNMTEEERKKGHSLKKDDCVLITKGTYTNRIGYVKDPFSGGVLVIIDIVGVGDKLLVAKHTRVVTREGDPEVFI